MLTRLALFARDTGYRTGLRLAAETAGLAVHDLTADVASVRAAAEWPGTAFRAPGGLLAAAIATGVPLRLSGPNPGWFAGLSPDLTGRTWRFGDPEMARSWVSRGPTFVKLADAKHGAFPARRFTSVTDLDEAVRAVGDSPELQLLVTRGWLPIDSEYRVFTAGRRVLTFSPYRVQDDPWTPLLRTHQASFHEEAAGWARGSLAGLPDGQVPPAAVLDVARLSDGRFILLEANQPWGAGLYGCDPRQVLVAVLAGNKADSVGADHRWAWSPDPAVRY